MTTTGGKRRTPRSGQPRSGRAKDRGPNRTAKDRSPKDRSPKDRRPGTGTPGVNRPKVARLQQARLQARQARRRRFLTWAIGAVVVVGAVTALALTVGSRSGSTQSSMARPAPSFVLKNTSGKTVSLSDYRGHDVVLFFNEGVGCGACFYQMREFEQHASALSKAGITILPIVMNPASEVRPQLASYGLHTPYLIDASGSVSRAYGTLGKGMHAGLPGHGFVLVDGSGTERWYGEYPSMYLSTAGLLKEIRAHLPT